MDGRHLRVNDMSALARAIAAQAVRPRVDRDHQTEPSSRNYANSTRAIAWGMNPRVNERGGLDMDLNAVQGGGVVEDIASGAYGYISPGLSRDPAGDLVMGLSSIALTNRPNLDLPIAARPSLNDDGGEDADELRRQREEIAAEAVDAAIEACDITPAERDYHLSSIRSSDSLRSGLQAFRDHLAARRKAGAVPSESLQQRTSPRGAPPPRTPPAAFTGMPGAEIIDESRVSLHESIVNYAAKRQISYREAAVELGAQS